MHIWGENDFFKEVLNEKLNCFISEDDRRINCTCNLSDLDNHKPLIKLLFYSCDKLTLVNIGSLIS